MQPETIQGTPTLRFALTQGSPVVAALWGILIFRELKGGDMRLKMLATLMLVFFLCGLAMIGLAPLFLQKA